MLVAGFVLIVGVPFVAGVAAMAIPVGRLAHFGIAISPIVLVVLYLFSGALWLGDIGMVYIAFISIFAWLVGVGASRDIRSLLRHAARVTRT